MVLTSLAGRASGRKKPIPSLARPANASEESHDNHRRPPARLDRRRCVLPARSRLPARRGLAASFPPEELFTHAKPAGVERFNLIQISFYGFDNSYMLDMIAQHPGTFVGTAVIDPLADHPEGQMDALAGQGVSRFAFGPCSANARWRAGCGPRAMRVFLPPERATIKE